MANAGRTVRLSPAAEGDLAAIWAYLAAHDVAAADRFLTRAGEFFTVLGTYSEIGRLRPDLGEGVRSFPLPPYITFYRTMEDAVEVVRVLHGARDIAADEF